MRKTTIAVVFAAVMLLPRVVHATTITITEGGLTLLPIHAHQAFFFGAGLFVNATSNIGVNTAAAFGASVFEFTMLFGRGSTAATVQAGGAECRAGLYANAPDCGAITVRSGGLPAIPPEWPRTQPFVVTVPFVASGFVNAGGARYQIGGQGTLTGTVCLAPTAGCPIPEWQSPRLTYTFTVAEPPSVLLTAMFGLALGGIARRRRRGAVTGTAAALPGRDSTRRLAFAMMATTRLGGSSTIPEIRAR